MSASAPEIAALVLAAGKGARMRSGLAKVLHPIAGRPMLHHVLAAVESLAPARLVVVVGTDAERVTEVFAGRADFALQEVLRGTGDAVLRTERQLEGFSGDVLVLYGDAPLLLAETLRRMADHKAATGADLVLLSAAVDVPGIVVRDGRGQLVRIVEASDATPEELSIEERNTGVYLLDKELLWKTLGRVDDHNEQGEIYLTSIVELLLEEGRHIEVLRCEEDDEGIGVNTRAELARAEAVIRARKLNQLMLDGVTLIDPATTYVDVGVEIGRDTVIEPGCVIQGASTLGERVHVKPHCVIESSELADDVEIGPSAHLRPGTRIGAGARIGNFVEIKNSELGAGVKADHLSYIGDADVGDGASFGCGAIVVNYDWVEKHRTKVGSGAKIGCNVNLVAPVEIGRDANVAAGTTVTKNVPDGALAVSRSKPTLVEGWRNRRGAGRKRKPEAND